MEWAGFLAWRVSRDRGPSQDLDMSPGDPESPDVSLYELTQLDIGSEGMAEKKGAAKITVG
jgi:hypothetical protein